jgi:hypothetical protein
MIIFAYIFITSLIITTIFFIVGGIIEKTLTDSHPVKKWWRKHIVAEYPYDGDSF